MALHLQRLALPCRRTASTIVIRTYASSPYPFTKPGQATQQEAHKPATPYPFTDNPKPMKVSPPTRPVDKDGTANLDSHQSLPHNPDYNAAADYRTSSFSPIPMRVQDGSEPGDIVPAAVLSGAPTELQARTVRIFRPAKTATQSGDWHGHHWQMDWDILGKGHRWENPLMGWQSSADFMQGTHLGFKTRDDAIRFAEKQGYEYYVQEPNERKRIPKAYATQFLHVPGKLKTVRTK